MAGWGERLQFITNFIKEINKKVQKYKYDENALYDEIISRVNEF